MLGGMKETVPDLVVKVSELYRELVTNKQKINSFLMQNNLNFKSDRFELQITSDRLLRANQISSGLMPNSRNFAANFSAR